MPLAVFLARPAQRRALINHHAGINFRRLADHDAAAVVDKHAGMDFRGGMDFDTRKKFGALG